MPRRRWVDAGIIFGLVGMLTGTLSLFLSWRISEEEAAVALQAYPSANPTDLTHEGFGLRVELVNRSLRPVIVRRASLWSGGEKLSDATGYVDDVKLLDSAAASPDSVTQGRRQFPITVAAREGRTLALLMDVWTPVVTAATPTQERAARGRLNRFLTRIGSPTSDEDREIDLRLEHVPGGGGTFAVRTFRPPPTYSEAIRSANAVQNQLKSAFWLVGQHVEKRNLVGLVLRRTFAGTGQIELVDMDIWREGSLYHRSYTRPVVAQQSALFPLPRLPVGAYKATFRLRGDVVAYHSFVVPWRRTRCDGSSTTLLTRTTEPPDWCDDRARS